MVNTHKEKKKKDTYAVTKNKRDAFVVRLAGDNVREEANVVANKYIT
jgi:hypothetical protein